MASFALPRGEAAAVATIAVTAFFLIAITTTHGVRQIDRLVVEAAVHYGARGRRLFAAVLLPAALPHIFTGLRLGLGYTLIVAVAVEIVAASRGLGSLLWLLAGPEGQDMYASLRHCPPGGRLSTVSAAAVRLLPWAQDASS
jgi:ABC-type nitrate/sulfonate/bicarbonate transport system permease component